MSWLAVLLLGVATADLVHSVRRSPWLPEAAGAVVAVVSGLLAGLVGAADLLALMVIAVVVLVWGRSVTHAFARRIPAWVPLGVIAAALAGVVLLSGQAGEVDGPLADWLRQSGLTALATADPAWALLLFAVVLVQLSTGNVIVRLVLSATNTTNPARRDPSLELKGGRLLGPMERVVILGLGLAGQVTAAIIVIAAKGLLRFPELQSDEGQRHIHRLTEYFLVGSFVSWLVALSSLVLLSAG